MLISLIDHTHVCRRRRRVLYMQDPGVAPLRLLPGKQGAKSRVNSSANGLMQQTRTEPPT